MEKLYTKHVDLGEFGSVDASIHVVGEPDSIRLTKAYVIKGRDSLGIFDLIIEHEIESTRIPVIPAHSG